jgi:16S rRNA processing protein RimM
MWVPGGAKAGKISKPNGLQGNVNLILSPEAGKYIETDTPLFIQMDGQRVPFFVEEYDQVGTDLAIIKFEFIEDIEAARKLTGCDVFLDSSQEYALEKSSDYTTLIGYQASDQVLGPLGPVRDYIDHKMNPVFLIDYKGEELIVPAVDQFIDQIDHQGQSVRFILPEGLTSL